MHLRKIQVYFADFIRYLEKQLLFKLNGNGTEELIIERKSRKNAIFSDNRLYIPRNYVPCG